MFQPPDIKIIDEIKKKYEEKLEQLREDLIRTKRKKHSVEEIRIQGERHLSCLNRK